MNATGLVFVGAAFTPKGLRGKEPNKPPRRLYQHPISPCLGDRISVTTMPTTPVQKPPLGPAIAEIIPAVRALSRSEKFRIAQILLDDLAKEELTPAFTDGSVFSIYTPEYAPDAATQLAQVQDL